MLFAGASSSLLTVSMIAILQFDGVSLPHFHEFLQQGRLPATAQLRQRGHWLSLETPATNWEGATYHSLYSKITPLCG